MKTRDLDVHLVELLTRFAIASLSGTLNAKTA